MVLNCSFEMRHKEKAIIFVHSYTLVLTDAGGTLPFCIAFTYLKKLVLE